MSGDSGALDVAKMSDEEDEVMQDIAELQNQQDEASSDDDDEGDKKPAAKNLEDDESPDDDDEDDDDSSSDGSQRSDDSEDSSEDDDDGSKNDGLSDYEKLRLERIKRNQARLEQLGLASKSGGGAFGSLKPKKAPRPAKKRQMRPERIMLPKRSSRSRSAKKRIDYSRDIDFRKISKFGKNESSRKSSALSKHKIKQNKRPRAVRWIHDEFRRLGKQRRLNAIAAKRHAKAASKELKYWRKQMDLFLQKKRRHFDFARKQQLLQKERQELGGYTKVELLREIDRRTPELQKVLMDYNIQEANIAETEEQRLAFLERIKQQQALERKMQMIDALDRFPKSLKDATTSLNSMLYHRSPKDPPPPRRSKRNSDVADENPDRDSPTRKKGTKEKVSRNDTSWTTMVVEKPTVVEVTSPPRRKKEVRNVGGWISPPLAMELDRRWLEREKAIHNFDLKTYVPQVGDTILYYPGLHQLFLEDHPDVVGKMTRNVLRVPLWQRAAKERSKKKKTEGGEWWTDEWIDSSPSQSSYPIICRVERTHAEFPPDPYSHYKTVQKDGTVVWQLPKSFKPKKTKAGVRLAVMLKPLTPVLPPRFDSEDGFVESEDLSLPPKFTVSTVPTEDPFLVPFVWAYALTHSVSAGDSIDLPDSDSSKAKIKKFDTLEDDAHGSFRLDDKLPLIHSILKRFQEPNTEEISMQEMMEQAMVYEDSGRSFSATDASLAVGLLQSYVDRTKSPSSAETSMKGSLLDLVRSTLPLSRGVEVALSVYNRNTVHLSRWQFSAKKSSRTEEVTLLGQKAGFLHTMENSLRIKIVCCIEDFLQRTEHAGIFSGKVVEDGAPGYYTAVPIGMHFYRILNRLKLDKQSTCYYTSVESVLSDFQAIADNCLLYNSLDSDIAQLCTDIISSAKGEVSDIFNKHVREQSNRIKAEQERRRFVLRNCDSSALKEDDTKSRGKGRAVPDGINAPYEGQLYRNWIQRIDPDGSWHREKKAATDSILEWAPQSGDIVHYSRQFHTQFVKGHIESLAEEQCMVPRFSGASDDTSTDDAGDVEMDEGQDRLSTKLQSHWLLATVVNVRISFPRTPEKEESFSTPSPILAVGLRFPYPWAMEKVHYVCWRPCTFQAVAETKTCATCALRNLSFLKPAWIDQDISSQIAILDGFDKKLFEKQKVPLGIDDSDSAGIAKCIDLLKRRCLNEVDPAFVDPKLCIENAENGELSTAKTSGSRSLPVFKDFFIQASHDPSKQKKQTRDVPKAKIVKDESALELLSRVNFLPPWSMDSKEDRNDLHQTQMPHPCLCLELINLRLKSGYYRQPAAIVNDIIEAYVTTVFYALSQEVLRKKNRLSIRKIAKYLNSSTAKIRPTKIIRAKEARSKTKKNESLANDVQSAAPEGEFEDAEYQALSDDEKSWMARVVKIRKLYSMALVSVTDTDHLKHIFGLPVPKEKKGTENDSSSTHGSNGEKLQEDGIRHIQYLLSALARDPSDNVTSFRGQMKIKIVCDGKVISADKLEAEDFLPATSLPVVNSIQLGFHEMEKSNDLARTFIGQHGRRSPCVRCQVYGKSMLTCRLTMSHSNVDFDFVEFFKGAGGVDGLLRSAYPGTGPRNSGKKNASTKELNGAANAVEETIDPTENLKRAQTTLKLAEHLYQQAEILSQAPVTLGKDFIKTYFPVDPSDGHYVFCVICGRSGNLLCCEGCPTVVHADCIGLYNIPDGDWYCKECGHKKGAGSNNAVTTEAVDSTLDSNGAGTEGDEATKSNAAESVAPPKSLLSASLQFANERRQEVQEQNPGASSGAVSKILSIMWKNASDDLKLEFRKKETEQREAFKAEVEESRKKKEKHFDKTSAYASANAFIARMSANQRRLAAQQHEKLKAAAASAQGGEKGLVADFPTPNGINDEAASPSQTSVAKISAASTHANDAKSIEVSATPTTLPSETNSNGMAVSSNKLVLKDDMSLTDAGMAMLDQPLSNERSADEALPEAKDSNDTVTIEHMEETPVAVEEVDDFDYLEEVMKRAKIASIKDCGRKCKKGVGLLLKKNNAYCHICHNRSDDAYGFACQHDSHNYCTRHATDRFDLGTGDYTLDHCPICCLNCQCSACSRKANNLARQFKEVCLKQKLPGNKAKFKDILGKCATVSGARYSSFVAWDANTDEDDTINQESSVHHSAAEEEHIEHPKKPSGAYVYFGHEMRPKIFEENPETKFAELGKMLGDRWRALSSEEKTKYEDLSGADRTRYKNEMKEYQEKKKVAAKKNRTLVDIDDIEVPQKPYPAYFQFANARRLEIKKANPEASNGDVSRLLSEMWRGASDEFREFYAEEEAKQRVVYKRELEEYEEKLEERYAIMEAAAPQSGMAAEVQSPSERHPQFVDTSDIEPPQKPYPAYFQFANCRRLEIKAQNPGVSSVEITRILSGMWKNSSEEFKATFVAEETKQRITYKHALEEYEKKIRERYSKAGVPYPGSGKAATASPRYQVDHLKFRGQPSKQPKRRFPMPAISDEVFEEQTRNLESLLEQLQAYHPAPFRGYPSQKREKERERPVIPIGTVFKKSFDDLGEFTGKITRTPGEEEIYYSVEYEDGDEEELSINGLLPMVPDEVREEYYRAVKEFEAKPKKKRGRPRKNVPAEEGDDDDGEYVPEEIALGEPKKKRGRPRKSQPSNEDQPKRKTGRPRLSGEDPDEEPKRKRGRPRKSLEPGGDSPPKRRGRPRKSFDMLDAVLADEEETPKKARGRPRKAMELAEIEGSTKKPRGRPRKTSIEWAKAASPQIKRRGRPPKKSTATPETIVPTQKRGKPTRVADKAPAKKRGRPRRSVQEPVVELLEESEKMPRRQRRSA